MANDSDAITKPLITIKNLNVLLNGRSILKDINADFCAGKIYGIIGRNGSGKTVLLKSICGFLPYTGEIRVNGDVIGKDVDFPRNVGFIIETPGFLTNVSGYRNLRYLASIRQIVDKTVIRDTMKQVGLNPDDSKNVGKYSLGMRQRLGLAQAIMENPQILILDEPMNSLDEDGVNEIRNLLLQMKANGKMILIASHYKEDIDILCDEVYRMQDGLLNRQSF